jgi:hypothetical protein
MHLSEPMLVTCGVCKRSYRPIEDEALRIEASAALGMTMVMLECVLCKRWSPWDLVPSAARTRSNDTLRCPVQHCTGWVVNIEGIPVDASRAKYGCGECSNMWATDADLEKAISEIVNRFPYRRHSYLRKERAWVGVALEMEPKNYEELVEEEPWPD